MEYNKYGYIRVSSKDQNVDRQITALKEVGLTGSQLYIDYQSGKDFNRPHYQKLLQVLKQGDILYIKSIDRLGRDYDEIIEKYVEMNIVHPFREGNGRSMRIWLDMMLKKQIGQVVDWSKIEKEDYLMAMERSPIKDIEIKYILNAALTDQINDREIYMKGIDHSYYYEGYVTYKTEEL